MPAAAVGLAAAVVGGGATVYAANKAATANKNAQSLATTVQANNVNNAIKQEAPYTAVGSQAAGDLSTRLNDLTSPVTMDQSQLEATPGYQFTKDQGLKSLTNQYSASGKAGLPGAPSGPMDKAALEYGTGLANKTYLDQWNIANQNKANAFNRLQTVANLGQTATGNITGVESGAANNISKNAQNVGAINAAQYGVDATAITNAANQFSNAYLNSNALQNATNPKNNQTFPSTSTTSTVDLSQPA
jgi:hypothetical protein